MPFKDPKAHAEYMRKYRLAQKNKGKVHVNHTRKPVNHSHNTANPQEYLLSYSRNKYQFVLYEINKEGQKTLVKSYPKDSILYFHNSKVRLTWGPDEVQ